MKRGRIGRERAREGWGGSEGGMELSNGSRGDWEEARGRSRRGREGSERAGEEGRERGRSRKCKTYPSRCRLHMSPSQCGRVTGNPSDKMTRT